MGPSRDQVLTGLALVLVSMAAGGCGSGDSQGAPDGHVTSSPSASVDAGAPWTKLHDPPNLPEAQMVWDGSEVLLWGGCLQDQPCRHRALGFSFDPSAGRWRPLPPAPTSLTPLSATWTGREVIFLGPRSSGVAFDPEARTWRKLPPAPIRALGPLTVWTGSELIAWGGGGGDHPAYGGVAYDPGTDGWRRIARAPIAANLGSSAWSGREMFVFGSLVDRRNSASTQHAVGAAYDPSTDIWRTLPQSHLSPQATSADWVRGRLVAWDYIGHWQSYYPRSDSWSPSARMPIDAGECYPLSTAAEDTELAFYCGQMARFDSAAGRWRRVRGGLTERKIHSKAYGRDLRVWQSAELASAGDTVFILAHGLTLSPHGTAQFGFPKSPISFWSYRPPD